LDVSTFDDHPRELAMFASQVAYGTIKLLEEWPYGNHAHLHDHLLQLGKKPANFAMHFKRSRALRAEVFQHTLQSSLSDHNFSREVHHPIETVEVNTKGAVFVLNRS